MHVSGFGRIAFWLTTTAWAGGAKSYPKPERSTVGVDELATAAAGADAVVGAEGIALEAGADTEARSAAVAGGRAMKKVVF